MIPVELLPVVLAIHITLAITLFVPSVVLPFAYRPARLRRATTNVDPAAPAAPRRRATRWLLRLQSTGSLIVGAGLALSGLALLSILGASLLERPWLLTALVIYALVMAIAYFVQRPAIRSVLGLEALPEEVAAARARRARYVSYGMGALIGTIGILMSGKPELW